MDVIKSRLASRWPKPLIIFSLLIISILTIYWISLPRDQNKIEISKVLLGTVQRGELHLTVDGYGILRSEKQTLITAQSIATVEKVVLRPGAKVDPESVILILNNPDLVQEAEEAKAQVTKEQANLRQLRLVNKRDLLAEEAKMLELKGNYDAITLRREVEQGLAQKGIVPQLTYKTTLLKQRQMKEILKLQQIRISQLKGMLEESVLIQESQTRQAEAYYSNIQKRTDRLTVRAGLKGVLQRLPVQLGQSVAVGQELALVGSDEDLLALIRVSQSKAEQLQVGQLAKINTRSEYADGTVTRIAPEVQEGTIEVEISFNEKVPASARPELNVDAQIFITDLKDALFVERPANIQTYGDNLVFKVDENGKFANQKSIRFGNESGRYIQIIDGAEEKDQLILTDMSNFRNSKTIRLVN